MEDFKQVDPEKINIVEGEPDYEPHTRFIPVSRWHEFHPWPNKSGIRYHVHQAKMGLNEEFRACLVKVGKRILINEQRFLALMEQCTFEL